MRAGVYSLAYLVPATALLGALMGGTWVWLTPVIFFGFLPILDEVVPSNYANIIKQDEADELENPLYNVLVRGWFPTQVAVILCALVVVASRELSGLELVGICLSLGIMGGAGINVAHELMHRNNRLDKGLAEGIMTLASYTHFCVEHIYGHHKNVATPLDPATSRRGESVYHFIPRSVFGGLVSFYDIESRLAQKLDNPGRSLADRRIRYPLVLASVYGFVGLGFGWQALAIFVIQGIIAFSMLEVINFLEHYGLERELKQSGRYERVEPVHSWSSPHRLTGWILFGLPRHADHHFRSSRQYPVLRHMEEAPQLPLGYTGMFLVALCPPLWRSIMDPRVDKVNGVTSDPDTADVQTPQSARA